jgi:hypothetical protein
MLRPLAYVTDNKPCGCIRPSAERGAKAIRIESGHASMPDPGLGYDTPFPGTLLWAVRTSLGGVRTLSNGFGLLYFGGPGCAHRGPVPSGSDGIVSENATLTAHEIPLGLFSVRLRVAAQASCLHIIVRDTPDPGSRQWPPGPSQGRMRAYRRGQSLTGDRLAAPARPLMQLLPARGPPMVTPTATPTPMANWPVTSILNAFVGPCTGCLESLHWFLKIYLLSLLRWSRGGAVLARAVVRLSYTQEPAPSV